MRLPTVFVSYAREDTAWKSRIVDHLRVLEAQGCIAIFHDSLIQGGDNWRSRLNQAIEGTRIAVLLVSRFSLGSEFITQHEVPAFEQRNVRLLPLLIEHCDWRAAEWLRSRQFRPADGVPLSERSNIDEVLAALTKEIRELVTETIVQPSAPASPPLLPCYIEREATGTVFSHLSARPLAARLRSLLVGHSGSGNSVIASQVFAQWDRGRRAWFDAERPILPNIEGDPAALVVIDNVDHLFHSSASAPGAVYARLYDAVPWLLDAKARVLALVRSPETARRFVSALGIPHDHPWLLRLDTTQGFTADECRRFVQKNLPDVERGTALALNAFVAGSPFAWMTLVDLVLGGQLPEVYLGGAALDRDEVRRRIFDVWFKTLPTATREVAEILCCVSLTAIDTRAIAHLLQVGSVDVDNALMPLVEKGFVHHACAGDVSWAARRVLRRACAVCADGSVDRSQLQARYRDYFRVEVNKPGPRVDFLTLVDAWLIAISRAFDDTARRNLEVGTDGRLDLEAFSKKYHELRVDLSKLMGADGARRETQLQWIAEALRDRITSFTCEQLIPIGQVFARMRTRNPALGHLLWVALSADAAVSWLRVRSDSWARAQIIAAAALHWAGQNSNTAVHGARMLMARIRECRDIQSRWQTLVRDIPEKQRAEAPPTTRELEHELCALIGGLCVIGYRSWAAEVLAKPAIRNTFPDAYVVYALSGLDAPDPDPSPFAEYSEVLRRSALYELVHWYAASKGFAIGPASPQTVVNGTYVQFVAEMSHAMPFLEFAAEVLHAGEIVDARTSTIKARWPVVHRPAPQPEL